MSLLRDAYYDLKPLLPHSFRMAIRRFVAQRQLRAATGRWPILPSAGEAPSNWAGWPDGKQFALVLTHDVEGQRGIDHVGALAELESDLEFRSSFNFIPEGSYRADSELLQMLVRRGFEIGVHDLRHDGKLYRNKKAFEAAAPRINKYLGEWNAVGFRSGFMHRNLEWLHSLDIEYDMSTFDTDPFEPQPDGAETIFPFYLSNGSGNGYVELPYTLPQDSTLFLVLKEKDIRIWKQKLDWVAARGGMALVNVHPDYMSFEGERANTFPAHFYQEFLEYARGKYGDVFSHLLPRDVAALVRKNIGTPTRVASAEAVA